MSTPSEHDATAIHGPHSKIAAADDRERFALELFDLLWDRYRERVSYVRDYERVVHDAGATFVNDHIAFRTFACQSPLTGIASISRIFEALGYRPAGCYEFPDKQLDAIHYQHRNPEFPKIFVSELRTWELPPKACEIIERTVSSHRPPIASSTLAALTAPPKGRSGLLAQIIEQFQGLPWTPPEKGDVEAVNEVSQYAAWVLVHGYEVNHFTSLINSHGVGALEDIDKTIAALQAAGVPMKESIEGERGSKLRQSATKAVVIDVAVRSDGADATMPWTYAYFELAERGNVTDPETGREHRFEGFLGPQATQLFEMTRGER